MVAEQKDRNLFGPLLPFQLFAEIVAARLPRNQKIDEDQIEAKPPDLPAGLLPAVTLQDD